MKGFHTNLVEQESDRATPVGAGLGKGMNGDRLAKHSKQPLKSLTLTGYPCGIVEIERSPCLDHLLQGRTVK
ncbi:hypothetical protein CPCC7001_892 [Cyanobium sp. PCC 7001]|nr:hypothetical protein CPCC7001_892 [Cyanobium sp. PCC 7001]